MGEQGEPGEPGERRNRERATAASDVVSALGNSRVVRAGLADVARIRERTRRRRIVRLVLLFGVVDGYLWYRLATHNPLQLPQMPADAGLWLPALLLIAVLALVMLLPLASGRSPHLIVRPEHIEVGLEDVRGMDAQVDEIVRSLNVFLGYSTFRNRLGGNPRRGILFEGPPGTGKTFLAKAMAKQAGVPFLFVSAPAFQSMWFGMTNVKIRSFFRALRKAARREGGAIGFIEEIDAIGVDRGALGHAPLPDGGGLARTVASSISAGTGGMVNELLVQMQSFDQPPLRYRMIDRMIGRVNAYLPSERQISSRPRPYNNILLIAATNRADALDRALLRPGRFDRRLYFDLPTKQGRRELIDYFLERKSHGAELDEDEARERLAHDTFGYSPVMIEHLFDESLLVALRRGREEMRVADVQEAKLTEEVGLAQMVTYSDEERRTIATHEAGHATVAHVLGVGRRLEILSIIKRRGSLGLLGHSDEEERFTRSRSELETGIAIALGGLASEQVFLGESGTGPANDLAHATEIAAMMVGSLGLAGSLVSFDAVAEGPVSRQNLVGKVLGDREAKARVEDILEAQRQRAQAVLEENRDVVFALRDALLDRDELLGDEIGRVIREALSRRN